MAIKIRLFSPMTDASICHNADPSQQNPRTHPTRDHLRIGMLVCAVLIWRGETCSIWRCWRRSVTTSTTPSRATTGPSTAQGSSSIICSATECWTPETWWTWPATGPASASAGTARPEPSKDTSKYQKKKKKKKNLFSKLAYKISKKKIT